jgi:hypothetical protein
MAKKCKHCSTVVEDAVSMCPNCQNLAFTDVAKVELSNEQFQELVKSATDKLQTSSSLAWRLTWRVALVIFAILGIPGAIVGWSIWSSMQSFEQTTTNDIRTRFTALSTTLSNQIEGAHSAISSNVVEKFEIYKSEANNQLASAYASVTNQIAEEFQTPKIKQTVETVAKGEAKSILETEVQPAVTSFKEDALFMRTIARAQGYDFKAYQALLEIGKGTNEDSKIANQVLNELDRSLARDRSDFSPRRSFMIFSGTNFYSGPFTDDELAEFSSVAAKDRTSFNREGFVNAAADFKQPLFLPLFIGFLTNETDLGVADRLTIAISDLAKQDFHPRDYYQIIGWWGTNQLAFTNWPFAVFEKALHEFGSVHYQQAADAFGQVIQIDPMADMSRAYAIASLWESGDTNRAIILAKDFKNPSGRWAQWASAKAELESGNISNATVHFYSIMTNFPTMEQMPSRNFNVYRKIDWVLFDKLKRTKTP